MAIMGKIPVCGALAHEGVLNCLIYEIVMIKKSQEAAYLLDFELDVPVYENPVTDIKPVYDGTETDDGPVYEMEVTPTNDGGKKKREKIEEEDKNAGYE